MVTVPVALTEEMLVAALRKLDPERRRQVIEQSEILTAESAEEPWGTRFADYLRSLPPLDSALLEEMREDVRHRAEAWGE